MEPIHLSDRFAEAFAYALDHHRSQLRKDTTIPYVSHLMQVAGLVLEAGGDEDQAIAGLFHDAIEDPNDRSVAEVRRDLEERFGPRVLHIVEGCTDTDVHPKPDWEVRKKAYLDHLRTADDEVLLVSAADKLHNARSILTDLREHGRELWDRFNVEREDSLWYYRSLVNAFREAGAPGRLVAELERVVTEIERVDAELGR